MSEPLDSIPKEELVHRVCEWLCEELDAVDSMVGHCCKKCFLEEETPYGPGKAYCVIRAQQLIDIVRSNS